MIDPRAVISPKAHLDEGVTVGPFAVIGDDVVIGKGTIIAAHAMVNGPTEMGCDNHVFQFASIGDAPQDKKYKGEPTKLVIGDRNVFRESSTMNRGTALGHGVTRIGSDNLFMAYSHVGHDCIVGSRCILSNCTALAGHVELDDWVILSGYAAVHQFCKVGAHAFLANNAAVTRDVPPYLMVAGSPAEPVTINAEGLKRRGFSPEQIANLKHAYKVLYRQGRKFAEAEAELARLAAAGQTEVGAFLEFFPRITRSLIR
ncbi:MAG: acyl-ACP--UDP-N-acetylglucosamine O-acyltransferase [Gammaproteobacteria bacterium]